MTSPAAFSWRCCGWPRSTFALRPNADLDEPAPSTALMTSPAPRRAPAPATLAPGQPSSSSDKEHAPARSAVVANPVKVKDGGPGQRQIRAALARPGWPAPQWLETTWEDPGGGQTRQAIQPAPRSSSPAAATAPSPPAPANSPAPTWPWPWCPSGTGNLLAANLRLPARPAGLSPPPRHAAAARLDVGVVEGRCFTVMAGMGFDAQMLRDTPETLKARLGWPAYVIAAARHLCETPMQVSISLDGGPPFTRRARSVLVGNVGELRGGLRLLPGARPDDGLLDVAVLMPPRRRSWLPLAWSLLRHSPPPR